MGRVNENLIIIDAKLGRQFEMRPSMPMTATHDDDDDEREKSRTLDLLSNEQNWLYYPKFFFPTSNCRFILIGLFVYLFIYCCCCCCYLFSSSSFFLHLLFGPVKFGSEHGQSIYWDKLFNLKTLNGIFVNWNDTQTCKRAKWWRVCVCVFDNGL